jgi:hypothetical protein
VAHVSDGFPSVPHKRTMKDMGERIDIQRICVNAKPARAQPEYYEWQTASVCMFIAETDKARALEKARSELSRRHWEFLTYGNKSTLIEERVREVGGEVWEAFEHARRGRIFFKVFPDCFGAGNKIFHPILPPVLPNCFWTRSSLLPAAGVCARTRKNRVIEMPTI